MQQVALPSFPRSFRRRSLGDHAHHDLRLDEYVPQTQVTVFAQPSVVLLHLRAYLFSANSHPYSSSRKGT